MRTASRSNLLLVSGGIDSTVCAHLLRSRGVEVTGFFVNYGQAAAKQEALAAHAISEHFGFELKTINFSVDHGFSVGELPGRNAFFVFSALMASSLSAGQLILGIHKGTPYYDCSPAFVDSMQVLLSEHTDNKVRLNTPLLYWNKAEIFEYCRRENLPIEKTYSCEAGSQPQCGFCLSCLGSGLIANR